MTKFVSYQRRAQFTNAVENYVGLYNAEKSANYDGYVEIYHPILNGVVMLGTNHTNAFNVVEVPEITGLNWQGSNPL